MTIDQKGKKTSLVDFGCSDVVCLFTEIHTLHEAVNKAVLNIIMCLTQVSYVLDYLGLYLTSSKFSELHKLLSVMPLATGSESNIKAKRNELNASTLE